MKRAWPIFICDNYTYQNLFDRKLRREYNAIYGVWMSDVVYRSNVRIERVKGPVRRAYLPAESEPVIFGVHGAVAEHYKVPPNVLQPHATTLDYVVAATAG